MALSFTLLGSGSTGNATLVSDGDTHVLVDVGLSGRETTRRLSECGLTPDRISAIVVSHEHGDHCRGIAPFARHLDVPVFVTEGAHATGSIEIEDDGDLHPLLLDAESNRVGGIVRHGEGCELNSEHVERRI